MKFDNPFGSNEQLRNLCKALHITEAVCKEVDDLDEKEVSAALSMPHKWQTRGYDMSLALTCFTEDENKNFYISIGADEGPHIDLVLEYIKRMIEGGY